MSALRWCLCLFACVALMARASADGNAPSPATPNAGFVRGEGFRIQSADGLWRLRIGLHGQVGYEPTFLPSTPADWAGFRVSLARLRLEGNLLRKWIRYWFSIEFATFSPSLFDGWVDVQPWKFFGIRLGCAQIGQGVSADRGDHFEGLAGRGAVDQV